MSDNLHKSEKCAKSSKDRETLPKYAANTQLVLKAQTGDESASEELMLNNIGLVRSIATRFCGRGTDLEDLMQIGNIGMLKAIRSFDIDRGTAFSTYAVPMIMGEIRRFLRDDGLLKVARPQKALGAALSREREQYMRINGREPGIAELATLCGVNAEEAAVALLAVSPVASLSEPAFTSQDSLPLCALLSAESEQSEPAIDKLALREALDKLPTLWRKIILLRYYRDYSQQQTGDMLGLTQVKVSREEKKIVERLREELC